MDVQEAVRKSIRTFGDVFPQEMQEDLRLEQVELLDEESTWYTTLSFRNREFSDVEVSPPAPNSLAAIFGSKTPSKRVYKVIKMRSQDGKLLGILDANQ